MNFPRYYRAKQSYCWYTREWHLYVFPYSPIPPPQPDLAENLGFDSGFTVKHRLQHGRPEKWRHWSLRLRSRRRRPGYGRVFQFDAETHLSDHFKRDRVLKSKRYFRIKICI